MKPSLGRIVIYVETPPDPFGGQHRAAIITAVHTPADDSAVDLTVFGSFPEAAKSIGLVPYSAENAAGSWHWPPRV